MKSMDPAKKSLTLSLIAESIRLCEEMGHDLTACQLQLALDRLADASDSVPSDGASHRLEALNRDIVPDLDETEIEKAIRRP